VIARTVPAALGEFEIVAELGHGGSSVVYDAVWGPRRVALKVLHPELVGRTQFLAEAKRLQAISHPSVVKVLAVGELPDGRPYLAMERLDGETLSSRLGRGPLPLHEALAIFDPLCDAVATLHARELVHRDLKPENVFIVDGKHAVLLDFGIAKEIGAPASTTTQDGGVRGTPAYMAPERFFGQPAGVATDIYELAVILYAMVAGRLPWDNLVDPEARLSPKPLDSVPPALDIEIRRAMSTRPANRPISAEAFRGGVQAAMQEPVPGASETAPMRPAEAHLAARDVADAKVGVSGDAPTVEAPPLTTPPPAEARAWFADRDHSTERGKTPLAWAPSSAGPTATRGTLRRLWWLVAAIALAGVVVAITVLTAHRGAQLEPDPVVQPVASQDPRPVVPPVSPTPTPTPDPWGPASVDTASTTPTTATTKTTSSESNGHATRPVALTAIDGDREARRQMTAAVDHLPGDTHVVVQMVLSELMADQYVKALIDKLVVSGRVAMVAAFVPPCVKKLLGQSSWFVYGMVTLEQWNGVLVAGGAFERQDIEACFAKDATRVTMPDGAKLFRLRNDGFVDFIDDHTAIIAMRKDLTAAKIHALATTGGAGGTRRTLALVSELPANRSLAVSVDGKDSHWPADVLPVHSDLSTWIRVLKDGIYLDFMLDAHAEAPAKSFESQIRPQIDELFANTDAETLGKLDVVRDGSVVRVRGKLGAMILSIAVTQL